MLLFVRRAFLVVFLLAVACIASASDVKKGRPLDLPAGGRTARPDDNKPPAEVVHFYGEEIDAEAYVFLVHLFDGECGAQLTNEVIAAIGQLSRFARFTVIASDSAGAHLWRSTLEPATGSARKSAVSWINACTRPSSAEAMRPFADLAQLVDLVLTGAQDDVAIVVAANCSPPPMLGGPCGQTPDSGLVALGVPVSIFATLPQFWADLAQLNHGSYVEVVPIPVTEEANAEDRQETEEEDAREVTEANEG